MTGVSTDAKNMTIEDCGLIQMLISRRLLKPCRLTESEIKCITDLNTLVALLKKALAEEKDMDRLDIPCSGDPCFHPAYDTRRGVCCRENRGIWFRVFGVMWRIQSGAKGIAVGARVEARQRQAEVREVQRVAGKGPSAQLHVEVTKMSS